MRSGLPCGEPLRGRGLRRAGLPSDGAAGFGFGAAGVLPGLLVQQPQRPPRRRPAVHRFVVAGEPVQLAGDRDRAGGEQVDHVLADAANLGTVAVGPELHRVPESGQPGLQDPVSDGCDAEPLVVKAAGIQGPPLVVGAVGALDPVPDRHVRVQLRVSIAGQVVQENTGDQAAAVTPLPCASGVVAGAGVGGVLFQPATASRAESISAASIAIRAASRAAAWSRSPPWRAWRAATR